MPGKVKVKIISGKNLPVMDRSSDTTDAYVEIKLGNTTYKTEVCRRTLHPQWNSEWYRFEVDDSELQDEPLQIRLMDHDTYSANDAIGKVYLNLNPLLLPVVGELGDNSSHHEISGWIPVYDTMHGIRGEVNVTVKVELFSDFNRFRQSSCGVHFFYSPTIPQGYQAKVINGFVEELIVDDDPEYQWIDKIRTPRASNEARQTLFFKLSGELQRKIGVKALGLGANAVIGYKQCFDLEGESGIVARGIGTAVTLVKTTIGHHGLVETREEHHSFPAQDKNDMNGEKKDQISPDIVKISNSPLKSNNMLALHRRSSDSDLSITPKGNSLTGSDRSVGNTAAYFMRNNYCRRGGQVNQDTFEILEFPFLTMSKFPSKFILHIAGSINARSVKLLERISNVEEPESRDIWWSEIRMEIRSHARSLNCNVVLGYTESTSICEDVCVLSACGTAAVIDFSSLSGDEENLSHVQVVSKATEREKNMNGQYRLSHESPYHKEHSSNPCSITHLPFDNKKVSMKAKFAKCFMCHKGRVPEVLVATIEPPESLPSVGKGCFIEAHVLRPLKDLRGETIAKEISDGLPFLEYELHRLLINKLKIKSMNAIFGLQIRITLGEKMIVGVATGTGMYLSPLPSPDLPILVTDKASDEKRVADLQNMLYETVKRNKEIYQIKDDNQNIKCFSDDDSDEELTSMEMPYSLDTRDCYVLEVDDPDDAEVLHLLMENRAPSGFHVVNTESVLGLEDLEIIKNLQMFTQIYRAKIVPPFNLQTHFIRILQSVYFKLRRMVPCALCNLQFRIALPEPDEIQLYVIGMALGLGQKTKKSQVILSTKRPEEELMFKLDEDHPQENSPSYLVRPRLPSLKSRSHKSPSKTRPSSIKHDNVHQNDRHGVDITPLSYVPGATIEQYLGNLNFFFIRETTSIREEGGLSGFIHSFVTEVLAIVRSHVTALGGNALVAYFMTECVLNHNLHKNQGQCLINVGGDVVSVSYIKDDT